MQYRGFIAGFVATAGVSGLMLLQRASGLAGDVDLIGDLSYLAADLGFPTSAAIGWLLHFATGVLLWGGLFAIIRENLPTAPALAGALFGTLAWIAMILVFLPLTGKSVFASGMGGEAAFLTFVFHLVFGLLLAAVYGPTEPGTARSHTTGSDGPI